MSRKWLISLIIAGVISLLVVAGIIWLIVSDQPTSQSGTSIDSMFGVTTATPPPDPLAPIHVVIMGHGGAGHEGAWLADTIMVAQIIPRSQVVNLYNLPRDLWVKLPFPAREGTTDDFYTKINAALSYGQSPNQYRWRPEKYQGSQGGGKLMAAVVEQVVGQPINYFVSVDFSAFKKIIYLIAGEQGLKVDLPFAFADSRYPITGKEDDACGKSEEEVASLSAALVGDELEKQFPCRYETISYNAGVQYLPADDLLKYARSRHGGGMGAGDFSRAKRQQVVIEAVKNKLLSAEMLPKLPELLGQVFNFVGTDLDLTFLKRALVDWQVRDFQIVGHVIDDRKLLQSSRAGGGQYVLIPRAGQDNYEQIWQLVQDGLVATTSANATL